MQLGHGLMTSSTQTPASQRARTSPGESCALPQHGAWSEHDIPSPRHAQVPSTHARPDWHAASPSQQRCPLVPQVGAGTSSLATSVEASTTSVPAVASSTAASIGAATSSTASGCEGASATAPSSTHSLGSHAQPEAQLPERGPSAVPRRQRAEDPHHPHPPTGVHAPQLDAAQLSSPTSSGAGLSLCAPASSVMAASFSTSGERASAITTSGAAASIARTTSDPPPAPAEGSAHAPSAHAMASANHGAGDDALDECRASWDRMALDTIGGETACPLRPPCSARRTENPQGVAQ